MAFEPELYCPFHVDFAALCFDEIWQLDWHGPRAPPLDVVIIDYSYTSSVGQLAALVDKLRSLPSSPDVLALLYCPHQAWQHLIFAELRRSGVSIPSTAEMLPASVSSNTTALNTSKALDALNRHLAALPHNMHHIPVVLRKRVAARLAWARATGRLPNMSTASIGFRAALSAVFHHRDMVRSSSADLKAADCAHSCHSCPLTTLRILQAPTIATGRHRSVHLCKSHTSDRTHRRRCNDLAAQACSC